MHYIAVWQHVGQIVAAVHILVNYFHPITVLNHLRKLHGNRVSAHYQHLAHINLLFATYIHHLVYMVMRGGYISYVVFHYHIVASRYDCLAVAFDCRHMQKARHLTQVLESVPHQLGIVAQFHAHHYQFTVKQLKPVAHPSALQCGDYFFRRQIFRINQVVNTQSGKIVFVLFLQELVVVDSRHRFFRAKAFCHGASHQIARLKWRYGYEEVGAAHVHVAHHLKRDCAAHVSHQVIFLKVGKFNGIVVNHYNVLIFVREHFCQMRSHFASPCYQYLHSAIQFFNKFLIVAYIHLLS